MSGRCDASAPPPREDVKEDEAQKEEPFFTTPANLQDFKKPLSYKKWSLVMSSTMNECIKKEELTVGKGKSRFYNPKFTKSDEVVTQTVTWNGFPRRLLTSYPHDYFEIADEKTGWIQPGWYHFARNQDEYLEWFVHKNKDGQITKIDFTCESPEYFQYMFQWEPEVCLDLYRKHVSKDVQVEDLLDENGKYFAYNKWNTTDGCMHLQCPPNSLAAEVYLAGDATIVRKNCEGEIVTNAQDLINCSQYGLASRNSDPHIGAEVNTLAQAGFNVSLANPVALYIMDVSTAGWTLNGEDASKHMKLVRGTKELGLRYELSVDDGKHTVSDILIGGVPITYGGQVAEMMDMGLVAEAFPNPNGIPEPYPCVGAVCDIASPQSD